MNDRNDHEIDIFGLRVPVPPDLNGSPLGAKQAVESVLWTRLTALMTDHQRISDNLAKAGAERSAVVREVGGYLHAFEEYYHKFCSDSRSG